jgi:hypothetical protein
MELRPGRSAICPRLKLVRERFQMVLDGLRQPIDGDGAVEPVAAKNAAR